MAWQWPWQRSTPDARVSEAIARVAEAIADQVAQEMADDVRGFTRLGDRGGTDLPLSELREIRAKCIDAWRIDGTLGQACNLVRRGVFGRGIDTPKANDPRVQRVIDMLWHDVENQLAITGREGQTRTILAMMLEGERFLTVHTSPADAAVKVADIPVDEITGVVTHPHNRLRPLLWQRTFRPMAFDFGSGSLKPAEQEITWYYRDWRIDDQAIADDEQIGQIIDAAGEHLQQNVSVYQIKTNTLGHRGVPEIWRVFDWVRTHAGALSDMATMTKALSMFAWTKKVQTNSAEALAAAASMARNPAPGPGAIDVHNQNIDLAPVNVGTGQVSNHAATERATGLEIIKPFGFGEHWYGNAATGNLATATAMELPAIWTIQDWQSVFEHLYRDLIGIAIKRAQANGSPRLPSEVDDYFDVDFPDAQPWHPHTIGMLIQALVQGVQYGLLDEQEASYQAYQALGTNDIAEVMARQFGAGAPAASDEPQAASDDDGAATADASEDASLRTANGDDTATAEGRAQEAQRRRRPIEVQREFAGRIQRRVIDPWWRRVRAWLNSLDAPPAEGALRGAIEIYLAPDMNVIQREIEEGLVAAGEAGGQAAIEKLIGAAEGGPHPPRPPLSFATAAGEGGRTAEAVTHSKLPEDWATNVSFRLTNPELLRRLAQRGRDITGMVTESMLDDLHTVLVEKFYREGLGPRAIAKDLDSIFPRTYANRAENIARTETATAQQEVTLETYRRNGVRRRQWLALLDANTRPEHAEAHGQVRDIDEPFDVGGEQIMYPGDGSADNACNCRCDVLPVIDDDTALPEQPWLGD